MKIDLEKYAGKNIHVVGVAGAEGSAIAEFLVGKGFRVIGHDFSADAVEFEKNFNNTHLSLKPVERAAALAHLRSLPMEVNLRPTYLAGIQAADVVFVSQVWFKYPANAPLRPLFERGIPFQTITNLYFEFAPCPIISVTGTNGKTTTSNLLGSILRLWQEETGRRFWFAGNDRLNVQVLDQLETMRPEDVFLLETSSTQLVLSRGLSPRIGIITNITPNHIEDHGSFENYIQAKESMIENQQPGDFAVLNADNEVTAAIAERHPRTAFCFSIQRELAEGCFLRAGQAILCRAGREEVLFERSSLQLPGQHNLLNALAAAAAARLFGVEIATVRAGIAAYAGIKHRLKLIYNIGGVSYYDDVQATTPEATIAGIRAFEGDLVLVAGGDNKGMDYAALDELINRRVRAVVLLPGDASGLIEAGIDKTRVVFDKAENLTEAMAVLRRYKADGILASPATVLISPASAHFYSKFVESSGKDLKEWIKELR